MASEREKRVPDRTPFPMLGYFFKIGLMVIIIESEIAMEASYQQNE